MANEITVNQYMVCQNGKFKAKFEPGSLQITQTTLGEQSGVLSVATSATNLAFTVATAGVCCLTNCDSSNFVTFGDNTSGYKPVGKLKAGESAILRLDNSCTFALKADTATVKVQYIILND